MKPITDFIIYVKNKFELDESSKILILNNLSSNLILLVEDENEKYIVKCYYSRLLFVTELLVLLKCVDADLKTPRVIYSERENSAGWNWLIYEYIEGEALFSVKDILSEKQLSDVFFETGKFLQRFHNFEFIIEPATYIHCIKDIIDKTEQSISFLEDCIRYPLFQQTIEFVRNAYCLLETTDNYTFVIGDFNDKHILLYKNIEHYGVSGIIDFEMVRYSNRFSDLVSLYISYFLENEVLEFSFWKGYELVLNEKERSLISFFILQYALNLCGVLKNVHIDNKIIGEVIIQKVFKWLNNNH